MVFKSSFYHRFQVHYCLYKELFRHPTQRYKWFHLGTGFATPREGATVDISYKVTHLDRDIETRDVKFTLGDGSEEGVGEYSRRKNNCQKI